MINSHQFTNSDYKFVAGIFVSCRNPFVQFRIYGTFENNKNSMFLISFFRMPMKINIDNVEKEGLLLKFHKPVNVLYLKIDFIGENISFFDFHVSTIFEKTFEDTLSFLKDKKIGFLGLARDCHKSIGSVIHTIEKLGSLFSDYHIYLLENDSIDTTRDVIKSFGGKPHLTPVFLNGLDLQFPKRTSRLAFCRNALLHLSSRKNFDYIICFDADGVFENIDIDSFVSVFQYEECWDAAFPVMNPYYDLWAFRHSKLLDDDFEKIISQLPLIIGHENSTRLITEIIRDLDFSKFVGWLSVDSAFGGFGIYKSSIYYQSSYWGEKGGSEICEHVPFHRRLKELGANLYIVPAFKIS